MDTRARQQAAILIPLFLIAFAALVHIVRAHAGKIIWESLHLTLIRFSGNKTVLELLHDLEEIFEAHQALRVDVELLEQVDCLLWVAVETLVDRLKVSDVDELRLLFVEHIEDASVVLDLLLGIFAPDVELVGAFGRLVRLLTVDVFQWLELMILTVLHLLDAFWVHSSLV